MGSLAGRNFGEFALSKHLAEKVWRMNRSANRLSIVTTNLDDFSLANHGRFAKFAKLSPRQTFPPYGIILVFIDYYIFTYYLGVVGLDLRSCIKAI